MHQKPFTAATERRSGRRWTLDARSFASLDGDTVIVHDISRGGVSIVGQPGTLGGLHLLELHLNRHHMVLQIEIVDQDDRGTAHARFVNPPDVLYRLLRDNDSTD